ncbi:MAG: hypothetical protein COW65_11895 [Cytophagales bacterium CG18_big_fil_WC_8_21_14_2_50_42_9]|nr:MAG: hypothetical protein COW65_11895 [Cytophagales bacterium CG18_big_fil_WC_8_21_14_2_50_42_9]
MKNHPLSLQTVSVKICFLFILFLAPFFSFAQLGKYEFAGDTATNKNFYKVTNQPAHATFSRFRPYGVNLTLGKDAYNTKSWVTKVIDYSDYIEFSITVHSNYTLYLNQIQFESSRSDKGPTQGRVAHNASGNFTTNYHDFTPNKSILQKTSWDFTDIEIKQGDSVTFRIYGLAAVEGRGAYKVDNVAIYGYTIPQMSINEFHYANTSTTKTGFVEVIAPKDFTELNTATLSLYNAEGKVYDSYTLDKFSFLPESEYGDFKIYYLDIPTGLVDGTGGLSLSVEDHLIQFISYGGTITAVEEPAINTISENTGVEELAEDGAYNSIALMPNMGKSQIPYSDTGEIIGNWEKGMVNNNTKGYDNTAPYQVLPVELIYFRAKTGNKDVSLMWATATEINNKEFVIERSLDNVSFRAIGKVNGHGTTLQQQQYQFQDLNPLGGTSYYRLKQIDLDGAITYSKLVAVTLKELTTPMALYPNPAADFINVSWGSSADGNDILVQVLDLKGQIMYKQLHQFINKNKELNIALTNLPTGSYYLVVTKDGKREAKPFLKR